MYIKWLNGQNDQSEVIMTNKRIDDILDGLMTNWLDNCSIFFTGIIQANFTCDLLNNNNKKIKDNKKIAFWRSSYQLWFRTLYCLWPTKGLDDQVFKLFFNCIHWLFWSFFLCNPSSNLLDNIKKLSLYCAFCVIGQQKKWRNPS